MHGPLFFMVINYMQYNFNVKILFFTYQFIQRLHQYNFGELIIIVYPSKFI